MLAQSLETLETLIHPHVTSSQLWKSVLIPGTLP